MLDPGIPANLVPLATEVERCCKVLGMSSKVDIYSEDPMGLTLRYVKAARVAEVSRVRIRLPLDEDVTGPDGHYLVSATTPHRGTRQRAGFEQKDWLNETAQESLLLLLQIMIEEDEDATPQR